MKITRRSALTLVPAAAIVSSRAEAAEFTYKYGNQVQANHPVTVAMQRAADKIKAESGGRLEIAMFSNSQLGGDTDMLSQIRTGALEFFTCSPLVLSSLVSVASINGLGFAFKDSDVAWAAMDGDLGALVRANIAKFNIQAMEKIWDSGYRQITSSAKPINTADDLKGFKIRVPVSPLWTSMFKAFGASPTGINFSEVYSALQTKIVDGQETPGLDRFGQALRSAEILLDDQPYVGRLLVPGQHEGMAEAAQGLAGDRRPQLQHGGVGAAQGESAPEPDAAGRARSQGPGLQRPRSRLLPRCPEQGRLLCRMARQVRCGGLGSASEIFRRARLIRRYGVSSRYTRAAVPL
jgi:hypothetical protein